MSKITVDEVGKLAKLARLGLTNEEKETLAPQMTEILNFAEQLDEVDISGIEPTSQVTGLQNVYVNDAKVNAEESRADLLRNAPESGNGFIKVKAVLE